MTSHLKMRRKTKRTSSSWPSHHTGSYSSQKHSPGKHREKRKKRNGNELMRLLHRSWPSSKNAKRRPSWCQMPFLKNWCCSIASTWSLRNDQKMLMLVRRSKCWRSIDRVRRFSRVNVISLLKCNYISISSFLQVRSKQRKRWTQPRLNHPVTLSVRNWDSW